MQVVNGRADVGLASLSRTKKRAMAVQFGDPLMDTGIAALVKRPALGQPLPFSDIRDLVIRLRW
jgi:hypothetical protein